MTGRGKLKANPMPIFPHSDRAKMEKEKYRIEQFPSSKSEESKSELLNFVQRLFLSASEVKKRQLINEKIKYARGIYASDKGKAYYATVEDDANYDDSGRVRGTKRFSSKIVTRKIDEMASILTDERPRAYIEISKIEPKFDKNKTIEQVKEEYNQKLTSIGGLIGLKESLQRCGASWGGPPQN